MSKSILWNPFPVINVIWTCVRSSSVTELWIFEVQEWFTYSWVGHVNRCLHCTVHLTKLMSEVAAFSLDTQSGTYSCWTCSCTKNRSGVYEALHPRVRCEFVFHLLRCTLSRKMYQDFLELGVHKTRENLLTGLADILAEDELYWAKCLQVLVGRSFKE